MQYFHIVIGDSAAGSLKCYLKPDKRCFGKIISFIDDLSIGSIYKLEENIEQRLQWINKIEQINGDVYWDDDIVKAISKNYNGDLKVPKNCKVIIWHANGVNEQTAVRYLVNQFKNYELYEVMLPAKHIVEYPDGSKTEHIYISSGCFEPETLGRELRYHTLISEDRKDELVNEWQELRNNKGLLRILENGKIKQVDEQYYDSAILNYVADKHYIKAARVVGHVLGHSEQNVTDFFIHYRLKELIEQGKIKYKGELKSMRDYEVSLNYLM